MLCGELINVNLHVFRSVIFVPVSILMKLIFLSIHVCVFDEKWL